MDRLIKGLFVLALYLYSHNVVYANSSIDMDSRNRAFSLNPIDGGTVDQVDPHSGNLTIRHRDLVLPGNGGMDIVVWRVYNMASMSAGLTASNSLSHRWAALGPGWSISAAPRLSEINTYSFGTDGKARYSGVKRLQRLCSNQKFFHYYAFLTLDLPDGSSEAFYSNGGYEARSKNNWKLRCSSGQITATSPNGVTHHFGHISSDRYIGMLKLSDPRVTDAESWSLHYPALTETYMVAKSTVDLNGNQLTYTYKQVGNIMSPDSMKYSGWPSKSAYQLDVEKPARLLERVESNDGRFVSFTYDDNTARLVSMSDNLGRTWSFSYISPGNHFPQVLSEVTLPEGLKWSYMYVPGSYRVGPGGGPIRPLNINTISAGKLSKITYPTGGSVSYDYSYYDLNARIGSNRSWVTFYSRGERVARRTLSTGPSWSYAYSRGGLGQYDTTTVNGPDGVTTYKHMGPGYAISTRAGYPKQYKNNAWRVGQLMEKTYPTGAIEKYTWQPREFLNSYTRISELGFVHDQRVWVADLAQRTITRDGATYTTSYSNYDTYGNAGTKVETGPDGGNRTTYYTYYNDAARWLIGKPLTESSPGNTINRSYDANGNLIAYIRNGVTTSYTYDIHGNVVTKTFPRGLVHYFSNYHRGIPQEESQPEGVKIYRKVDGVGNVSKETNGEGHTTYYTYNGLNQLTSIFPPTGNETVITYGANYKESKRGDLIERTDFDGFGRVSKKTLGDIVTDYHYDAFGRLTFESNPNSSLGKMFSYDAHDRIVKLSNADNTYKEFTYSSLSLNQNDIVKYGKTDVKDERGNITSYIFQSYGDPNEQYLTRIITPISAANITIDRYPSMLVKSVTQGGITRTYGYNDNNYLTSSENPEIGITVYGRDIAGNMISKKVGGNTTKYIYDKRNRLELVNHPDSTPDVTYSYNKVDKILGISSSKVDRLYYYDYNGNIIREEISVDYDSYVSEYLYNGKDQLNAVVYPASQERVDFFPDALGRPTQVVSNVASYVANVKYWPSGQLKQITYANGTITNYSQNSRLWPSAFSTQKSNTYYLNSNYDYDGAGNLLSITDQVDSSFNRSLSYDKINRLIGANGPWGTGAISYDGQGNITSQIFGGSSLTYDYNPQNRLIQVTSSNGSVIGYSYDSMGNVSARGAEIFNYDSAPNMLCGRCTRSDAIHYLYDGNQQRVRAQSSGMTTYEFTGINGNQLMSLSKYPEVKQTYFYYLGNKRIAQREMIGSSQWSKTYYHNDLSGSPMVATNENGNVFWKENYKPYGGKLNHQQASLSNQIGFHGQPFDNNTGLSYMGARYYDPLSGRFMGIDPKGFDPENIHSFNRYAYANNNPYKYVDPDGHSPLDIVFLAYDIGKLGIAIYTGVGIGSAATDVAMSVVGVASPIPGAGQALKAARAADKAVDSVKAADNAPKYARNKYKSVTRIEKKRVLEENKTCVYCDSKSSTQVDHIRSQKQDWVEGGFKDTREVRSARVNDPSNLTGSCQSCNASKGSKPLGAGVGQWTPPKDR